MTCVIWGTPVEVLENKTGDFQIINSPRAGGKYWISGTAAASVGTFTPQAKALLTTWLCDQRRAGVSTPQIDTAVLDLVKSRRPLSFSARLTAALLFLEDHTKHLGAWVELRDGNANTLEFFARTESSNGQEVRELFRLLEQTGLVEGTIASTAGRFRPTVGGWKELDNLKRVNVDASQAFIAMWFHASTDEAFLKGIVPAVTDSGYSAMRIDKKDHNNKIDDEIIAEIRRSRFVVADFTCESKNARGGVYFEAGYAQGMGIPVIWTCKDTSIDDLHFDTRQYSHIVWTDPQDLYFKLKNRIGSTIGDGPLPKPARN